MICFEDGIVKDIDLSKIFKPESDKSYICLLRLDELRHANLSEDVKKKIIGEFSSNMISKFENHDNYDIVYLKIPPQLADKDNVSAMAGYVSNRMLLVVYEPWKEQDNIAEMITNNLSRSVSPVRNFLFLLDMATRKDFKILQDIETEITDLEDSLMTSKNKDYIEDIVDFRKRLLELKRYYEQLVELFDDFDENENSFLNESELKYCGNISNRVNRLHQTALNLRDYVTQVREAYQSQVDINLNVTMKVFTVITAIFLPLTLVAGWYGMNLQMPEFSWDYGYLFVISLSVTIVVFCIVLFKKNKWF